MRKRNVLILAVSAALLGGIVFFAPEARRLYNVIHLFDKEHITENFRDMKSMFEYHEVHRDGPVRNFARRPAALPSHFVVNGQKIDMADFLEKTWTTGFIVIKGEDIVHESYYRGNDENSKCISWSVGKSIVSALLGIAFHEGLIKDIHDPITNYLPVLKDSGYDGVPIKDIMNMSSGIHFDEDYGAFNSDINRMGRTLALRTSMQDFILSLKRERPSGKVWHYVSMDTQVLGMLLRKTTGRTLSEYLQEKIWTKAGMESNAYWLTDSTGMELAFGTLNVTLRDFARFGALYRDGGRAMGQQIVPAGWVKASVVPDAPHLMPGKHGDSTMLFGYGYQWWIPEHSEGDFLAIGVYNQFIYVNPGRNIVIVKTSAYPDYNKDGDYKEYETTEMFQTIARSL